VPLWLDILAAGVAVAAFSIFFSMPLRMLGWPVAIGMIAHALRWWTLSLGGSATIGAFVACLVAGLVLTPVAHRYHMPFAVGPQGFADAGVFQMSGLLNLPAECHLSPLELSPMAIAFTIILAMSFGIIVPKIVIDLLACEMPSNPAGSPSHERNQRVAGVWVCHPRSLSRAVTGIVDAVSFLALGHVFTANMTGNVIFLGFAIGGASDLSVPGSLMALVCFAVGAVLGGWMTRKMLPQDSGATLVHALVIETICFFFAAAVSIGFTAPYADHKQKIFSVIALTAVAMGLHQLRRAETGDS
jgi:hypothetical protein